MARNRGCVALGEKRACRWDFESLLQVVCRAQALFHMRGTLGAGAPLLLCVMQKRSRALCLAGSVLGLFLFSLRGMCHHWHY